MSTTDYGKFYWCVRVTNDISSDGEIYLMADWIVNNPDGSITFFSNREDKGNPNLILSAGKWKAVYAASMMDGGPVAIEHWDDHNDYQVNKNHSNGNGLRFNILKRDNYTCQICGRTALEGAKLEVDHKIPKSKGGEYVYDNLWTLCFECNRGKSAKEL